MTIKSSKEENNRVKQMDFVSRLTFIKGLKDVPEKKIYITKEKKKKKFKQWCMPTQPDGYIKCRRHDFF